MKTISITRALVELKRIQKRIDEKLGSSGSLYCVFKVGVGTDAKIPGSPLTVDACQSGLQANADSLEGLIKNYQKVKSEIVRSNAKTYVDINGESVSVADAIEMKTSVKFKKAFRQRLVKERATAVSLTESANVKLQERVDQLLTSLYGSDKSKISDEQTQSIMEIQKQKGFAEVVGLEALDVRIARLDKEIETIESELDFILSESNARTSISVDLTE